MWTMSFEFIDRDYPSPHYLNHKWHQSVVRNLSTGCLTATLWTDDWHGAEAWKCSRAAPSTELVSRKGPDKTATRSSTHMEHCGVKGITAIKLYLKPILLSWHIYTNISDTGKLLGMQTTLEEVLSKYNYLGIEKIMIKRLNWTRALTSY